MTHTDEPVWKRNAQRAGFSGRPWLRFARPIAYWTLSAWLVLGLFVFVSEIFFFYEDSDTYRRVYSDPALYQSTNWVFAVLYGIAAFIQAMHWRTRRISWAAVALAASFFCFQAADSLFAINPICCT